MKIQLLWTVSLKLFRDNNYFKKLFDETQFKFYQISKRYNWYPVNKTNIWLEEIYLVYLI